jgi:hypothetical protein
MMNSTANSVAVTGKPADPALRARVRSQAIVLGQIVDAAQRGDTDTVLALADGLRNLA